MILETPRLILTTWQISDWTALRPIATDPEVMRYITNGIAWTDEHILSFVKNQGQSLLRTRLLQMEAARKIYGGNDRLLRGRVLARRARYIEVEDASPVMTDDEEAVQHSEGDGRHGEKVHGSKGFSVIAQERKPSLCGVWARRSTPHPSRHASLRKLESQHDEFAVNARSPPSRILGYHFEDQLADLLADGSPA